MNFGIFTSCLLGMSFDRMHRFLEERRAEKQGSVKEEVFVRPPGDIPIPGEEIDVKHELEN